MPSIQQAYNWAVETCAAENVGYSQQYRNQQTVNGITYYDCSSFIWYALLAGGFDVKAANGGSSNPFWTGTEAACLRVLGFTLYDPSVEWKPGDVLIRTGHTEMAFDATRSMGAHTAKVTLDEQVSINANDSRGNWLQLWRWDNGAVNDWISGNRYLSIGEMQNNATIIFSQCINDGWTPNAIAGMLGNMQQESTINPGIWQSLNPVVSNGYGLVQWTPSTIITDWLQSSGYQNDSGDGQMEWLFENLIDGQGYWIKTKEYDISFSDFKVSEQDPEYLAYAFMYNFEKSASTDHPERQQYARYWYDWYNNSYVPPENPPQNGGEWSSKMPIWLCLKRRL